MRLLVPAASAAMIVVVAMSTVVTVPAVEVQSVPVISAPANRTTLAVVEPTTANATPVAPRDGFAWPLSPRPAVLRLLEQPRIEWSRGHRGVDLLAAVGRPVLSAGAGVVAFSGVIAGRGVITVRHRDGLRTTYEPVDERLASGTLVSRGARIGVVSPTPGHCLPLTCLHWGAISARTYQDPLSLLGLGRPILLPLG